MVIALIVSSSCVIGLLAADRSQNDARSEAISKLSVADSLDALQPPAGFFGYVYVYPDKSWVVVWQKRREMEHHQPPDWHESIARDSEDEWFECTNNIGILYSLPKLDPRFLQWEAKYEAGATQGDPVAVTNMVGIRLQRLLHALTVGPDLPTARNAMLDAGFKKIDPGISQPLPKVVINAANVNVPAQPTTKNAARQAALDQLTLNNITIDVENSGMTVVGTDDPTHFNEEALALLKDWPGVTNADFFYCRITAVGTHYFRSLTKLSELTLNGNAIGDAGLTEIGELPALHILHLQSTHITDKGLANLAKCKTLQELDISQNQGITGMGLGELSSLGQLHKLNLSQTQLTNAGMAEIAKLGNLEDLNLCGTQVDGTAIAQLGNLKGLKSISLTFDRISDFDVALANLQRFASLNHLVLAGGDENHLAIGRFRKQRPDVDIRYSLVN